MRAKQAETGPNRVVLRRDELVRGRRPLGFEQEGELMPIYLCRWRNGDVSLAAGESGVEVADVLAEVDNPDAAELMP